MDALFAPINIPLLIENMSIFLLGFISLGVTLLGYAFVVRILRYNTEQRYLDEQVDQLEKRDNDPDFQWDKSTGDFDEEDPKDYYNSHEYFSSL